MYDSLKIRGGVILFGMGLILFVFVLRLFALQVLSDEYKERANRYVIKRKIITPPRGKVYHKGGEVYVSNSPMFEMRFTPRQVYIPPKDTAVLVEQLGLSAEEIKDIISTANKKRDWREQILAHYIDLETYSILQEQLWNCEGISFNTINKRDYRMKTGANILGYISEVNDRELKRTGNVYRPGDLIGRAGIERHYDSLLRGKTGVMMIKKDVYNREVGSYANGDKDSPEEKGLDILLGVDTKLQQYGEELMEGKRGSIVAIEPHSGEIRAFVSAPSYDPSQLTGAELQTNWRVLNRDTTLPLFNRPLMAEYPPGSIFKLPMALAALNEGIITPQTIYSCGGGFRRNKGKPGCRMHPHPLTLTNAIKYSCNSYFAATYMDYLQDRKFDGIYDSFESWRLYMDKMGVGHPLGIDMPFEQTGLLPTTGRYDNEKHYYGKNRWGATNIISNSIGQGEILMTPLQMANMVAMIANRGTYYPPHFVRAVKNVEAGNDGNWKRIKYDKIKTGIDRQHFEVVVDAMEKVVSEGTARRAYLRDLSVCGKTGTVQNSGPDHAVFVGFAPKDRPLIAIAVIVENTGGGGGTWAAPVAALMIEKYLRSTIEEKKYEEARIKAATF